MWIPDWIADVSQDTFESLRDQYMPELPPVEAGAHLVSYLLDIGPTVAAGMGEAPLGYEQILAWQTLTGIVLQPWEARWLRRLSGEYLSEGHKATKQFAPPPWIPEGSAPPLTAAQAALARQQAMVRT